MNVYEFEIYLVPYIGKETNFLYNIKYKDKNLATLSIFLSSFVPHYSTYPVDILEQMLLAPDRKAFAEKEIAPSFNDIEMECDVGKPFLERHWSTGYDLGEITCVLGYENPNMPMVYYRALDDTIILISQNNAEILPTTLSIKQFIEILRWWIALPPLF